MNIPNESIEAIAAAAPLLAILAIVAPIAWLILSNLLSRKGGVSREISWVDDELEPKRELEQ